MDTSAFLACHYPAEIEQWWLERVYRFYRTRDTRTALKRQAPAADKLSDLFTKEREAGFGNYANEEEFLLAYGMFAFPQTFTRSWLVLEELRQRQRLPLLQEPELRIADLGCGAGGAGTGVLHFLRQWASARIKLTGIDQSPRAVELYSRLLLELPQLWPGDLRWHSQVHTLGVAAPPPLRERQHLIIISFALGELFYDHPASACADWLGPLQASLEENGLLLILEPALRETSSRLMALRDQLVTTGWQVLAPCPHAMSCPMLNEGKHWCHEVRSWQVPPNLQRLNEHLKRSVHELKFSFLALQPPGATIQPSLDQSRMVAPLVKVKGRYVTRVCAPSGQLEEWEIQTRTVEVAGRRALAKFERGDWVQAAEKKALTMPNCYRLPGAEALRHF
jgi:SAM-dependent methyltransferase